MAVPRRIRARVSSIVDHGMKTYSLGLVPEERVPSFKAGQFLHLALDEYEPGGFWPDSRAFSIASSSRLREQLRITYSVRGRFTARMEQELREGKTVWVKLPYGEFIVQDTGDVVLFAGGTGITAFVAYLDQLSATSPHKVYLAYGARHTSLLIYREWLAVRAAMVPSLQVFCFVEDGEGGMAASRPETVGRLSAEALWQRIGNPLLATYYISGPPAMLRAIERELGDLGVKADSIRIDSWG